MIGKKIFYGMVATIVGRKKDKTFIQYEDGTTIEFPTATIRHNAKEVITAEQLQKFSKTFLKWSISFNGKGEHLNANIQGKPHLCFIGRLMAIRYGKKIINKYYVL